MSGASHTEVLVIGGGMFGCFLACHAARAGRKVVLLEARGDLLQAASLVNQARVHNGYHYPRSILTGLRSRANFERFASEFPRAVVSDFTHLYAIARQGSHVTAQQFALFCERIGASCVPASKAKAAVFDPDRVEAVFQVKEYSFDSEMLRRTILENLARAGVEVRLNTRAMRLQRGADDRITVDIEGHAPITAHMVLHCTYAELNSLAFASGSQLLPVRQEVVEIALMCMPDDLRDIGWTIMDGPFSSSLPFPARNARSLYHVRYSVHGAWNEMDGSYTPRSGQELAATPPMSHVQHMVHDGSRFVPGLRHAEYLGSLWTIRTKLPGSAQTDSRPILFRPATDMPRLFHVMGGKIDNVYDLEPFLDSALEEVFG